jgi:hypothetical protein
VKSGADRPDQHAVLKSATTKNNYKKVKPPASRTAIGTDQSADMAAQTRQPTRCLPCKCRPERASGRSPYLQTLSRHSYLPTLQSRLSSLASSGYKISSFLESAAATWPLQEEMLCGL